jgi:elongation of very long chain fatty acids protein 7
MIQIGYVFFISKFIEFMDTVFFVLRKKDSQVSFLHVTHHSLVPISVWIGLKFAPGGNNALFPLLNSAVHTLMYAYYGLAALGPQMRKHLWWKRHLTTVQMVQFSIVILHGLRTFFMQDCHFPLSFLVLSQFNALLFLALFYSFYRRSYGRGPGAAGTAATSGSTGKSNGKLHHSSDSCARLEPNNNDANRHDHNTKIKAH